MNVLQRFFLNFESNYLLWVINLIFLLALLEGIRNNDVAAVDILLQYENVERKNFNVNGSLYESLLYIAAHNSNYEICKMLLKYI